MWSSPASHWESQALRTRLPSHGTAPLRGEIESLRAGGSAVEVVSPGPAFLALTGNGTRMLDNSLVPQAYEAGQRQALDDGGRIRANWLIEG